MTWREVQGQVDGVGEGVQGQVDGVGGGGAELMLVWVRECRADDGVGEGVQS